MSLKREPPPQSVLSEAFKERMKGRRLRSGIFLTYQLQPAFFELEILPVFLEIPLSHAAAIRHVQMEEALRTLPGSVAVYYDADGLLSDEAGSARLPMGRIPIRADRGVFHPKNVLLLVEDIQADEEGNHPQTLILAALSANLTRSGWWENIECAQVVEVQDGESTRLKEDLEAFLKGLRNAAPRGVDQSALQDIVAFLRRTELRRKRYAQGELLAHFFAGGFRRAGVVDAERGIVQFLEDVAGREIRGMYLEILSPFFDEAEASAPLQELIERFQPKEVRILLPRDAFGVAQCGEGFYNWIQERAGWGRLAGDYTRLGKSQESKPRFVHAKVYRFFSQNPKREICFLGSPNLTRAAHSGFQNVETGILIEFEPARRPDFWLTPEVAPPRAFVASAPDEGAGQVRGSGLNLRYDWAAKRAEASWEGKHPSPNLILECRGRRLGSLPSIPGAEWETLADDLSELIREALNESSLFEVLGEREDPTQLLVQETGMAQKPSLLLSLSASDILKYWALLTPAQRNAYLESRVLLLGPQGLGADLLAKTRPLDDTDSFFHRLAGIYHAFGCMERAIRKGLDEGNEREAQYRLFGRKYDSMGTLLDRLEKPEEGGDAVERYVILLCARQVAREIRRDYPDFWTSNEQEAKALESRFTSLSGLRAALMASDSTDMGPFLDWFDKHFLERAQPLEPTAP